MTTFILRDLHHEKTTQTDWHHHEQGQVFWVRQGILIVETQEEHWTVTAGCIGWVPSGCEHKTNVMADIQGHLLYLPDTWCTALPTQPKLVAADPFLSVLVERIVAFDKSSSSLTTLSLSPPQQRLIRVLIDELNLPTSTNLQLSLPVDGRALKVAHALISNPADTRNQTALAKAFGLSTRTLSRLFTEQTGLTFACWRQQARILSSLQLLVKGESVANVAFASGYDNVSSYIAVFRQRFGVTPKSYFPPFSNNLGGANLRGQEQTY